MSGSARKQVAVNLSFTLLKSVSLLLSLRVADALLTAQVMGALLLFRRQGVMWANLVQLGFSQSLQRYYIADSDPISRERLWGRLVRWVILLGAITTLLFTLFDTRADELLFGSSTEGMGLFFGVYVAGVALGYLAGSSWLVEFRFVSANMLDWLNGSLIFMACVGLGYGLSTATLAALLGTLTVASSLGFLLLFAYKRQYFPALAANDWRLPRNVTIYGGTRALTSFADMATVVIGPWLLRDQPDQAGYLIVAYSALRAVQSLALPIGQVLALRANSYLHNTREEQGRVLGAVVAIFVIACVAVGTYFVIGSDLLRLWLPRSSSEVEPILDQLIFFLPALCLFYSLRNYVGLKYEAPYNLYTLVIGVGVFLWVALAAGPVTADAAITASAAMFSVFYAYGIVFLTLLWRAKH